MSTALFDAAKHVADVRGAVKVALDAATTGYYAHAATTGHSAHAATTGHSAHAATTGHYAHAATLGYYAHAATLGYYAHAATTGHSAHAATLGYYAHAATLGDYAHAATLGYYAHAATTGNYAHAFAGGGAAESERGIAVGRWVRLGESTIEAIVLPAPGYRSMTISAGDGWPVGQWITMSEDGTVEAHPDVLLPDDGRGYRLTVVDGWFVAGCRRFTFDQAVKHWSNPLHSAPHSARLLLAAVQQHGGAA